MPSPRLITGMKGSQSSSELCSGLLDRTGEEQEGVSGCGVGSAGKAGCPALAGGPEHGLHLGRGRGSDDVNASLCLPQQRPVSSVTALATWEAVLCSHHLTNERLCQSSVFD